MTTEAESESKHRAECEVCGRKVCECPRPLGECVWCKTPIFDEKDAITDSEFDHWCLKCWPGCEKYWPRGES